MTIKCEACSKNASHPRAMHSMLIPLQKVTLYGYSDYQCDNGVEYNYINKQHWHCSEDCMLSNLEKCINTHYTENKFSEPNNSSINLHRIVFGAHLNCKVCNSPLTELAYRFCLVMATPYNKFMDEHIDETKEWCCSLEHAKQSAIQMLEEIRSNAR